MRAAREASSATILHALPHVGRDVRVIEQQMGLAQDGGQRVVDLVGHAGGQLTDRRELLGVNELGLRALELLELAHGLGVEPRVVERDADLVRGGLHQRDLPIGERVTDLAAERQRAENPAPAVNGDAEEAAHAIALDRRLGGRQQVRRLRRVLDVEGLAGSGHPADEPGAHGQLAVDLA